MRVPHPLPYQGSKRSFAATIVGYVPGDAARLIEPCAGSAAVTLAAAACGAASVFVLNDANKPLMRLWQAIITEPYALAAAYERLWHAQQGQERSFYEQVRAEFNRTRQPADLLYLLARCVKAAVRYNAQGAFNQSADHRRKGAHPATMRQQLLMAARLLRDRTTVGADDYRTVLDSATPDDVVYLDPPYQGVCGGRDTRYMRGFDAAAFVAALEQLNQRHISYIVSYDGRTGSKTFGGALPDQLGLQRIEVSAGRSSQATLLRRAEHTVESLYLSSALLARLHREGRDPIAAQPRPYVMRAYGAGTM